MNSSEIRQKIEEKIAKTAQRVAYYKELTQPVAPDVAIGRVSRMDAINNKSVTEAALRQAEEKLLKLKHALEKVDSPEFGMCAKCKRPIPAERILLQPESLHCVHCAR